MNARELVVAPLIDRNPVTLSVLGVCSALAITNSVMTALIMAISATAVLAFSNVSISLIRRLMPNSVRIIIEMTVIATGVIVVDQVLQAFLPDVSRLLSVFVGIGNGFGYGLVLLIVATVREIGGAGTWLGIQVLPLVADGGWYSPNQMMLLAPSAFFIIGALIWVIRSRKPQQVEALDFEEVKVEAVERAA